MLFQTSQFSASVLSLKPGSISHSSINSLPLIIDFLLEEILKRGPWVLLHLRHLINTKDSILLISEMVFGTFEVKLFDF